MEVARFQTEPRGMLRVSAPMSFSILHLGPALQSFLDVAVRIGRLQDSNLIARKIAPCRQLLCASPAYLAQRGEPERPEDLLEHSCVLYSLLSTPREWRLVDADDELHTVPINGAVQSNNGLVNRAVALTGGGIVLLPTFYLGEQLRSGALKPVLCKFKPQELAVYAVYPERRNLMPKVRAFVDFLATTFGPEPPWEQGWTLPE